MADIATTAIALSQDLCEQVLRKDFEAALITAAKLQPTIDGLAIFLIEVPEKINDPILD